MRRMKKTAPLIAAAVLLAPLSVHAQAGVVVDESPEQRSYEGRMDTQMRSWIHEGNHEVTEEERGYINDHWRRAARLWRIRKLAQEAKDNASIARVDALVAKLDHTLEEHIRRYREHAPVMTMAPPVWDVTVAPPPPQTETQPPSPGAGQVWTPGYWQWNGSRHVWSGGHWTPPPQVGMTWQAPKWENRAGHWQFEEGKWMAAQAAPTVVYEAPPVQPVEENVVVAPPPPIVEVRPAAPSPQHVWINGYWHWNGSRHVWVGGRWSAPRAGMRWEPDHWVHDGRIYKRVPGRWAK
jgi:hypothetical protein